MDYEVCLIVTCRAATSGRWEHPQASSCERPTGTKRFGRTPLLPQHV